MSGPSTATVGQPTLLEARGSNPASDFFTSYLDMHAIPTSVLSTCPSGYLNSGQIADSSTAQGGGRVAMAQPQPVDAAGAWSMQVGYTPTTPGQFLICGYTNQGDTTTLAVATTTITVRTAATTPSPSTAPQPATPSSSAAKPRAVTAPRAKRSGAKLVCTRGTWTGKSNRYAYRWIVSGKRRKGATKPTLPITSKLRGKSVRCGVTATGAGGSKLALSNTVRVR